MKIPASFACLVVIIEFIDVILASGMHFNVSSMIGAEDIYFRIKRREPSLKHPHEERHRLKENICAAILGSQTFDGHKVELVNPNHKSIYKQVKQDHPEFHEKHYGPKQSSEIGRAKFSNPYRLADVSVHNQSIREYVFVCLARNCTTKTMERYFVSPEYKANGSSARVRFVFTYNRKKEIVVIAMAETGVGASAAFSRASEHPTTNKTSDKPNTPRKDDKKDDSDDKEEDEDEDYEYETSEDEESDSSDSESW